MGFYAKFILPRLCHFAMRNQHLLVYRERVIGSAQGRVLEIGMGSGLNLPFYRAGVREILGLEPSPQLIAMARSAAPASSIPATFIETGRTRRSTSVGLLEELFIYLLDVQGRLTARSSRTGRCRSRA